MSGCEATRGSTPRPMRVMKSSSWNAMVAVSSPALRRVPVTSLMSEMRARSPVGMNTIVCPANSTAIE